MKKQIVALLISGLFLAGCGRVDEKQVSEIKQNKIETIQTDEQAPEKGGNQNSDMFEQGEIALNYELQLPDNRTVIKVMANADVSEQTGAIYQTKTKAYTKEELSAFATRLFDSGVFEVITPPSAMEREMLEGMLSKYEEEAEVISGRNGYTPETTYGHNTAGIYKILNGLQKRNEDYEEPYKMQDPEEEQMIFEVSPGEFHYVLKGDIQNKPWLLVGLFYKEEGYVIEEYTVLMPYEEIHDVVVNGELIDEQQLPDNPCDYEMAKQCAESFLDTIGLSDFSMLSACDNKIRKNFQSKGYCFMFGPTPDGHKQAFMDNEVLYAYSKAGMTMTTTQKCIKVYVDEGGVAFCKLGDFVQEFDLLADEVELMDLDDIDSIFREYVLTNYKNPYATKRYYIDAIKLAYISVYSDGNTVFLPAYLYYQSTDSSNQFETHHVFLAVSAVDGTVYVPCEPDYMRLVFPTDFQQLSW